MSAVHRDIELNYNGVIGGISKRPRKLNLILHITATTNRPNMTWSFIYLILNKQFVF